jgi:hypothetical protein
MKLKILALTALMTLCTVAPVEAGIIVDFGGADDDSGIIIVPSRRRYRDYDPRYRYDWNHPLRYHRRYRDDRFYHPLYRGDRPRHRYGRFYRPRRSYIQFRIGF